MPGRFSSLAVRLRSSGGNMGSACSSRQQHGCHHSHTKTAGGATPCTSLHRNSYESAASTAHWHLRTCRVERCSDRSCQGSNMNDGIAGLAHRGAVRHGGAVYRVLVVRGGAVIGTHAAVAGPPRARTHLAGTGPELNEASSRDKCSLTWLEVKPLKCSAHCGQAADVQAFEKQASDSRADSQQRTFWSFLRGGLLLEGLLPSLPRPGLPRGSVGSAPSTCQRQCD